jgi:hypothetical protein
MLRPDPYTSAIFIIHSRLNDIVAVWEARGKSEQTVKREISAGREILRSGL